MSLRKCTTPRRTGCLTDSRDVTSVMRFWFQCLLFVGETLYNALAYVVIGYNTAILMHPAITATTIATTAAAATTTSPCRRMLHN